MALWKRQVYREVLLADILLSRFGQLTSVSQADRCIHRQHMTLIEEWFLLWHECNRLLIQQNMLDTNAYSNIHVNMYIYIYGHPPPGPIRALGAGVIMLDNYIINMITCSKTLQIPVKNASWTHMTLSILTFQKEKNSNFLKSESGSEKDPFFLQILNHLHEKCTWPTLQKAAWEAKNAIWVKNICKQ